MSLKTVEEAKREFLARIDFSALRGEEKISVDQSVGRVTSRPIYARISVPHFAASAMDGFAVRLKSPTEKLFRLGIDAFEVNTGDPLPAGTNAVVPLEMAAMEGRNVIVSEAVKLWQHVRLPGEDVVRGDVVLPPHHVISPLDIGVLMASGVKSVWVFQRPKVLVVPTGSELLDFWTSNTEELNRGQLIEYMSYVALEYLKQLGVEAVRNTIVPNKDELLHRVRQAVKDFHLVLIIGGTSVGSGDFTRAVIEDLGSVIVAGIRSRPAKPTILGIIAGRPVIGVPGYPVSAFIAIREFAIPVISRICPTVFEGSVKVRMGTSVNTNTGFDEFIRMRISPIGDDYLAFPTRMGMSMIFPLAATDGLVKIPHYAAGIEEGEEVRCVLLKGIGTIQQQLLVIGEEDPILRTLDNILRQINQFEPRFSLCFVNRGSSGGFSALKKGLCKIAAVGHFKKMPFTVDKLNDQNGGDFFFMNIVNREIGLMLKKNNTKTIASLADIICKNLTFANLAVGYSPRRWLDKLLKELAIDGRNIKGYENEVDNIATIALQVEQGIADVGLGTYPVAKRFGLGFLPIAEESFGFAVKDDFMFSPVFSTISDILCSNDFKKEATNLGYSTKESGQVTKISTAHKFLDLDNVSLR